MRPDGQAQVEYVAAFVELARRLVVALSGAPRERLPVRMFVAGGAALHLYTGERVSRDVDAVFSHRIALPEDLDIGYRDADGAARLLYFDRQYNDSLSLMHEDAQDDSLPLSLEGVDSGVLEVRLLTPVDLAVSKLSRYSEQDRADIATLARRRGLRAAELRRRAEEAIAGYIGNLDRVRLSIELACQVVAEIEAKAKMGASDH
jgi:hypothetical protein